MKFELRWPYYFKVVFWLIALFATMMVMLLNYEQIYFFLLFFFVSLCMSIRFGGSSRNLEVYKLEEDLLKVNYELRSNEDGFVLDTRDFVRVERKIYKSKLLKRTILISEYLYLRTTIEDDLQDEHSRYRFSNKTVRIQLNQHCKNDAGFRCSDIIIKNYDLKCKNIKSRLPFKMDMTALVGGLPLLIYFLIHVK